MSMWYDREETYEETYEERTARTDRFGNETLPAPTPFDRVINRAYELILHDRPRPPRGIDLPFGRTDPEAACWRVSFDVYDVLRIGSVGRYEVSSPYSSSTWRLFGSEVKVDPKAEPGTLALVHGRAG